MKKNRFFRRLISVQITLLLTSLAANAQPFEDIPQSSSGLPTIREIQQMILRPAVYENARIDQPRVLRSAKDGADYFSKESLEKLSGEVDFDQQFVLLFAWTGSGRDRLTCTVAESYPEQVRFFYTRGKTRDLRRHAKVFALRSNANWSLPGKTTLQSIHDEEGDTPPEAAMKNEREAVQRNIVVRVNMPTPAWSIKIEKVVRVEDELWVLSQAISPPPDIISAQVIAMRDDSISGPWPDLPVRHYVIGHPWGQDGHGYKFIRSRRNMPVAFEQGETLYNAAD